MIEEEKKRILEEIATHTKGANIILPIEIKLPAFTSVSEKMSYVRTILSDLQIEYKYNVLSTQFTNDGYAIVELKKGEPESMN